MNDFLFELRSEEIPARMQAGARSELEKLFRHEMDAAGVAVGEVTVWSTPRRLALIARGLPDATEAVSEEAKGPPEGAPDQAIEGFCRKNGVTRDQLEVRDVKGRPTYFAVKDVPGRATRDLLAEAIPAIVRDFSWPKSMRWGAASISTESLRWVRPLSGIVALLGGEVVECEVHGIKSGRETAGHRFHGIRKSDPKPRNFGLPIEIFKDRAPTVLNNNGMIDIGSADDYQQKLFDAHVIVNHKFREDEIRIGAKLAAESAGLTLVEDEGLVIENAGLTEWPIPLLGRFEEAFLEVPPEVIQLTARVNQKYFVCQMLSPLEGRGRSGEAAEGVGTVARHAPPPTPSPEGEGAMLANAFICTANIEAQDGGAAIVDGNRKVLAARLADARFFWEVDRKKTLEQHAEGLKRITFHEKLGTVADKVERIAKLARWLVQNDVVVPAKAGTAIGEGANSPAIPASAGMTKKELADLAEQAARLAKADLVTEMVGEFPELQGLMGGYYARAEGLPDAVADAIRDHYKPVGQGDEVPTAPVTVAVSLADKLDTIVGFFYEQMPPSGSKDPFALRRAALGILALIEKNGLRISLSKPIVLAMAFLGRLVGRELAKPVNDLVSALQQVGLSDRDDLVSEARERVLATVLSDEAKQQIVLERVRPALAAVLDFFADRLKVQEREAGVRHDLIDAVFALGGEDDLVRLLARVKALQSFMETEDGANLLAGYKRAANILKKECYDVTPAQAGVQGGEGTAGQLGSRLRGNDNASEDLEPHTGEEDPLALVDDPDMAGIVGAPTNGSDKKPLSYTPEPAEKALIKALDAAAPRAREAVAQERFGDAMGALASLRAPIDAFFDSVTVNDPDEAKRTARLALLARFRDAVHAVADFGRIEG